MALALFALSLVLLDAKHTKSELWVPLPRDIQRTRWQQCLLSTMVPTTLVIIVFLLVGIAIGYQGAGWPGARARVLHPYIPTAITLYLPWALVQQTLFQVYLLGRLQALFPALPRLLLSTLNGLAFALVHVTNPWIAVIAALGGTAWSFLYLRYRLLWPLAISHALVGTTFYYWVYGHDLARQWSSTIQGLFTR